MIVLDRSKQEPRRAAVDVVALFVQIYQRHLSSSILLHIAIAVPFRCLSWHIHDRDDDAHFIAGPQRQVQYNQSAYGIQPLDIVLYVGRRQDDGERVTLLWVDV